jgi:hypothetical protein
MSTESISRGAYTLFEMKIVEDKFSFVRTCFNGGFVHILDLQSKCMNGVRLYVMGEVSVESVWVLV